MKNISILIAVTTIVLGIFISPGYSDLVTLHPTYDTNIILGPPISNTDNNYLYVGFPGGTQQYQSFLTFDLSSIPDNSTISSASLDLSYNIYHAVNVDVDRVQTESTVTGSTEWNNQPAMAENMGSFLTASPWSTWTLGTSGLLDDLADDAASLRLSTTSGFVSFLGSNFDPGSNYDPKLTITYQPAVVPIPASGWLLGSALVGFIGVGLRRKLGRD